MRQLATIQKVKNIRPIEGADKIEVCNILGWNVVIEKGLYNEGDYVIYCEIDSLMPEKPEFEFLRDKKFRIKTVKLRGQVSQGIVFPLSILPFNTAKDMEDYGDLEEGTDVTELLGVTQYDPYANMPINAKLAGDVRGSFPDIVPKTDETRVQILQPVLDAYVGTECYVTEKVDGSSHTAILTRDDEFLVCSRNVNLKESEENAFWQVAREYDLENKLRTIREFLNTRTICIQGEMIGPGIQGNKYNINELQYYAFNLFDADNFRYVDMDTMFILFNDLGIQYAPIVNNKYILTNDIPTLVEMAKGNSVLNPKTKREGIVIRPKQEISCSFRNLHMNRVSFKVINEEFLLKYGE